MALVLRNIKARMCVYTPYQGLFPVSHNQGVSRTNKHQTDFNWLGVNFLLQAFEVRMRGQSQTTQTFSLELVRVGCH